MNTAVPLSGAIMAGGTSRRMGRDKALLPFRGQTLLARTRDTLLAVCDEVFVVGRTHLPDDVGEMRVVADLRPNHGPLGGIETALCHARNEWVAVVAVDLPLLRADILTHLAGLRGEAQAVVSLIGGQPQPLCALYHRSCLTTVERAVVQGDLRLSAILDHLEVRWAPGEELRATDPSLLGFTNVNLPEEWARVALAADPARAGEAPARRR